MIRKNKKILIVTAPLILALFVTAAAYLYGEFVKPHIPPCIFHTLTGYYCCGCGGTRSLYALLNGDIITSIRCNPIVIFGAAVFLLKWTELLFDVFGKKIKLLPVKSSFWFGVMGAFLIFYIARNFFPYTALF